jgi:phosphate transport system substrate-binding protein
MQCPNCRFENEVGAKFCEKCGGPMAGHAPKSRGLWLATLLGLAALLATGTAAGLFYYADLKKGPSPAAPPPRAPEVAFRIHGSNTIGAKLAPALAEAFFRKMGAKEVTHAPGSNPEEMSIKATLPGKQAPQVIEIAAHGSSTAFMDLASGKCDIGMASRKVKPEEAQALAAGGDMTSPACEHVLALDGIAVILNVGNDGVSKLSKGEVAKIFSGAVTDWSEVGGAPGPIRVYARDDKSGTFDTFKDLVLGKDGKLTAGAERIEDSAALRNKVLADPGGIGFVGLPYAAGAKVLAVSEEGASALVPTKFTVATEDYTLSRRLFLYLPTTSTNHIARDFVEFCLFTEGQNVAEAVGFVSLNVNFTVPAQDPDAPAEYKALSEGARRANLTFRFRTGSIQLDNKGLRDLDRLERYLESSRDQMPKILLFGFADGLGTPEGNLALSLERAKVLAGLLRTNGILPSVVRGFGGTNFVAGNDSEEGRQKNRRVEVWVR